LDYKSGNTVMQSRFASI